MTMIRRVVSGLRILGILIFAHALMLLGADEISTIEKGGIRTIRSLGDILTLYGADPDGWNSAPSVVGFVLALPGWGVLAALGGLIVFVTRRRD
jgi:hypothetical protein